MFFQNFRIPVQTEVLGIIQGCLYPRRLIENILPDFFYLIRKSPLQLAQRILKCSLIFGGNNIHDSF